MKKLSRKSGDLLSEVPEIGAIRGIPKNNSWGKNVAESLIKSFQCAKAFPLPKMGPVAELWFGVHKTGTSFYVGNDEEEKNLSEVLESRLQKKTLTYLAKILSVAEVLSIQLHPDSETAKKLHEERPASYPDANAKPEMAIALSEASLLCGVRPIEEIRLLLDHHPGFRELELAISIENEEDIRTLLLTLLQLPKSSIEKFYLASVASGTCVHDMILQSAYRYLGDFDVGMPVLYLFSYITLKKGDAVFIDSGVPHAYVSGDLFECMMCSDNVVRGGLTPKEVDPSVFSKLVQLVPYAPKLKAVHESGAVRRYQPSNCCFILDHISSEGNFSCHLDGSHETILIVCVHGSAEIKTGDGLSRLVESGESLFLMQVKDVVIEGVDLELFAVMEAIPSA